jgi:SAM-dependent methyltransferase
MDAGDWDERYRSAELVWTAGPNRFVVERTADLAPGTALDLAAGEGRNALWLAERGWHVTALDYSQVGIERGARLAADRDVRIEWQVADATTAPFDARSYDLVLIAYLHLPPRELADVHVRAARAVAPGGTLLIVGHDRTNLEDGYGGPQDPTVLIDPAEVADQIRSAGLEVVEAERVTREVETDDGTRTAIDALVVGRRPTTAG